MKLKHEFIINEVAGDTVAVSVGENRFNGYIKLNETGKFIFEALARDTTPEQIISDMETAYPDATREEIAETVTEFIEKLSAADMLI
ncbi:MAG: PqqD family protein [Clostridia bacterium]|nr:PqqD family protein [Clostridia bacterium]MBQ2316577.1 PqqD family protein [Clostridia bacterium]